MGKKLYNDLSVKSFPAKKILNKTKLQNLSIKKKRLPNKGLN